MGNVLVHQEKQNEGLVGKFKCKPLDLEKRYTHQTEHIYESELVQLEREINIGLVIGEEVELKEKEKYEKPFEVEVGDIVYKVAPSSMKIHGEYKVTRVSNRTFEFIMDNSMESTIRCSVRFSNRNQKIRWMNRGWIFLNNLSEINK